MRDCVERDDGYATRERERTYRRNRREGGEYRNRRRDGKLILFDVHDDILFYIIV